ncbi:MAG: polysaccharide deacetylase family protein [Clostridia bacterium]|nr:polysaccharide deacetylase family protein [Clostridia bacterium]
MKLSKKRVFATCLSAICVFAIILLSLTTQKTGAYAVYMGGTVRKLPIYSVERNDNKISISFDCAYGADYTLKLLDVLDEYNVKCTFFCVEFWVEKYPDMVKEIVGRGHEIGTHSKTHPKMSKLSESEIKNELTSSINAIESLTGKKVELFRPPYGDYNDRLISVCESMGLYAIQWDVDSIDWKDISAKEIVNRVVKKTKSGSIILCHNNALHTHEALCYILSNLQQKGYEFVKISQLIYNENYKINSFGVQIKNDKQ